MCVSPAVLTSRSRWGGKSVSAKCAAVLAMMWVQRRFACLPGYFDFAVALG
ncbi:hypothetical protein HMPREF0262_02426 [Clostridium sp. ATCC 29733]|nr:hypothetical protein HMPREF0262_02426 [Clostridium sp. ATCC 29733]